jgi:hydroxymethylglutaryl-CoA lyase
VLHVVQELLAVGCYEISLGDTLGTGATADVHRVFTYLYQHGIPPDKLAGHFHDTYGQAVSNVWTAFQLGVRVFDSSVAGLGGCPYAPGARGNVATEDLVYLFQRAGVRTGVNLAKLAQTGAWISEQLKRPNDSRAGAALARKHNLLPLPNSSSQQPSTKVPWSPMENQTEGLQILRSGPNIKIILNRPKNGNTLTIPMISSLTTFFETTATDNTVTRIVLTANGKFFCTGMDLSKDSEVAKSDVASILQFQRLTRLFEVIDNAPQVTIAAVNGPAFGGGVGLAFACDLRIGTANTTFTLSEVKLGLCASTISKYVTREWGPAFTREAMLTARPIPFSQLLTLGFVSKMVESQERLDNAIDQYLVKLKVAAPRSSALSKGLVRASVSGCGGQSQADFIHGAFNEMMRLGGESEFGLREHQAKRSVDWDVYATTKGSAKL